MIDLHCHSTSSDGTDDPVVLARLAVEAGLSAFALTDHDILEGIQSAREAANEVGVRLVVGCELSCEVAQGTMHLLVYFLDDRANDPLQERLVALREGRAQRNDRIVERLIDLGLDITLDEVLAEAGSGSVGRPHFASVLCRKGHATSIKDAFDRWLAKGRPGYVERERLEPRDAIDLAHASGAVCVLAHPNSLELTGDALDAFISELSRYGLDGIEAEYARYSRKERDVLHDLAARHDLCVTGGSDYHGTYKPGLSLGTGYGDLAVPDEYLDLLEARRPTSTTP